jgi:hypothetical protein
MSGFPILEVLIGLAFIYLLLALICTTVTEWFARLTSARAASLHLGIRRMVGEFQSAGVLTKIGQFFGRAPTHGAAIAEQIYSHPLVQNLAEPGKRPSYIPASNFARALLDSLKLITNSREQKLENLLPQLHSQLSAIGVNFDDTSRLPDPAPIEQWYENQMDRVSGWYKRHTQTVTLIAAALITLATNADSLQLAQRLWMDPAVRATVVDSAEHRVQDVGRPLETVEYADPTSLKPNKPAETESPEEVNHLTNEEEALIGEVLGWDHESSAIADSERNHGKCEGWWLWLLKRCGGWFITVMAVSLGAPFWFDTLNRFMNIRSTGRAPDEKQDKSGKNGGGK